MTREVEDRILKDVDGNISDHLHNHVHLTNCIHLKNHIHKNSPTLGDRELMRDLVFLQRSRSLRDPSATPLSLQSPSVVDLLLKRGTTQDRQLKTPSKNLASESYDAISYSNHGNGREVYLEKNHEEAGNSISRRSSVNRGRRRRFHGARTSRSSIVTRDIEARKEMSVASNSFEESGASQNINGIHRNGCGIPLNWSTIHHRGKSFLDVAGRSLSCGLSESRLKKGGYTSRGMDIHNMPLMSSSSSRSDASNYLEDLGIYASNLLNQETDSDLASEGRSNEQHRFRKHNEKRHQTLTQKYKPATFKDLVGQSLVVQSLSNAIAKRKVGLLYLFYGPHGTGKTSCARIFSRALNCSSLEHPKPCGYCKPCIEQSTGKSVNVREIGPLSSNADLKTVIGVVGNANSSQLQSRYRVFIFDECDSVSSEWWSAIMKVVDRAPRRVVFILVCSSLEALPHVVISRCQKFFFPKIKDADVIYTLQWIATKEGLEIDKDAVKLIASRSDGSLRDAEMTLEQLSLLGEKISIGLVQEMVGLVSDEKLVDLLDLALSADTVNTVKNLRDIMESGVEPLALMSQLATVITDILAGIYDFTRERPRRKFFQQLELSKGDMEKLRQALRTFSEAEKQIRVSNERITWLTAALLQLAPSQDTSFNHSPLILNGGASLRDGPRKSNCEISTSEETGFFKVRDVSHDKLEAIWLDVLEKIKVNSVREFMYQEGKLIGVNYGAAPTVQLFFNSQLTKSKAENLRLHMIQAFESVLRCPVTIEFRCESRKGNGRGPILLPAAQIPLHLNLSPTTNTTRWNATTSREKRDVSSSDVNRREIVEVDDKVDSVGRIENAGVSLALVKSKVSLAHVIQHAEGSSQHSGWSKKNRAVSIAEKLELENLRLEPSSRRSLCWNLPRVNRRKLSRLRIRTRKPRTLLKFVSCGRCLSGRSPSKR